MIGLFLKNLFLGLSQVEEYGFAWQAGLRQGSRLVEICKVAAVTLTHEQMIDLLRTSVTVKVVIIPPYEEAGPRRCVDVCMLYFFEVNLTGVINHGCA